eukprot:1286624-Alexandrium_andersonii.AAC.1
MFSSGRHMLRRLGFAGNVPCANMWPHLPPAILADVNRGVLCAGLTCRLVGQIGSPRGLFAYI